jgi:hypothetical protein
MNIYLLSNTAWDGGYDQIRSMVAIAHSEAQARELANENAFEEGEIWATSAVACLQVGIAMPDDKEPRILIDDCLNA